MSALRSISSNQRTFAVAVIGITICLVLVLLAEAAVRIRAIINYGYAGGIEDTFYFDQELELRVPVANGKFGSIEINSLGFRSPEISQSKPPNMVRLAFLGGSTTYSAEVIRSDNTWAQVLRDKLAERFPHNNIDYINGGVPGYGVSDSIRNLTHRIRPLHPDVIFIYHATNDLSFNAYRLAVDQGLVKHRTEENLSWISKYSLLAYLVEKNLKIIAQQESAQDMSGKLLFETSELVAPFAEELRELVAQSKKIADVVVLVTFSHQLRRDQTDEQKVRAAQTSMYYSPFMTLDGLLDGFDAYNEAIRKVAQESSVILADVAELVPGDPNHFVDSVHLTDVGNRVLAEYIFSAIAADPQIIRLMQRRKLANGIESSREKAP